MTKSIVDEFKRERLELSKKALDAANLEIKRFYSLDSQAYRGGALPVRTKELLGLVASFVLRCDDCITYHLIRCMEENISDEELMEALSIGILVGGSITIPHHRRAVRVWEELKRETMEKPQDR